jgi:Kelch motif protein
MEVSQILGADAPQAGWRRVPTEVPSEPVTVVPAGPTDLVNVEAPNTWHVRAPMPIGRYGLVAATVNGIIYTIGGRSLSGGGRTVEAYHPNASTLIPWLPKASLPAARQSPSGAAVINGKIYVAWEGAAPSQRTALPSTRLTRRNRRQALVHRDNA